MAIPRTPFGAPSTYTSAAGDSGPAAASRQSGEKGRDGRINGEGQEGVEKELVAAQPR